jgi:transcriptional regulator with XRE-family HTH domain
MVPVMLRLLNRVMARAPTRRKTFIRAYRNRLKLSLEQVAAQLEVIGRKRGIKKLPTTASGLSMLERGQRAYTQETLEALAEVLDTDVGSLLTRDPGDPESIWAVWEQAKPNQRRQIVEIAKTLVRTGT